MGLGDNDRAARVLFVQHPRAQGEWCSQNPSVVRVLTLSFALLPRVLGEQHPITPVIIPIITRNSQIRDIFTWTSYRIALTEPPSRPSCSWKSIEHCHPLCTWIKAIARIVLNEGHKLTCWIWCMCLQVFNPCVDLCLIPNELLLNDSVWSSTSLCGTPVDTPNPLREAMTSQWSNLRGLLSLTLLSTNLIVPSMT